MAAAKKKTSAAKKKPASGPAKAQATKTAAPKRAKAPAIAAPPPKEIAIAPKKSTPVRNPPPAPPPPRPVPVAPPVPAADIETKVATLWMRLQGWIGAAGAPSLELNPPATEKAIRAAEKEMGLAFPPDFRASLRLHDGQASSDAADARSFPWLPGCAPLAPLDKIIAEFKNQQKLARQHQAKTDIAVSPNGRLKGGVYRTGRIPIAGTPRWDGDNTFIDLDPGPAGMPGQLITMVTKSDFVVIDTSFATALERWINVLERGLWIYNAERHAVHPRALAPQAAHPAGWFSKR